MLEQNLELILPDWPTRILAALGFPNGAGSGVWKRDWRIVELLRVIVTEP